MIGTTLGKYRLVAQLGKGGMAEVYKAYQPSLDRYVAIKILAPHLADSQGFVERFEREAALVARLRHPNIVQVYDFDVEAERYYMVMELIEGPTVTAEISHRLRGAGARRSAFAPLELVAIFTSVASAVEYAHARGMIHRDLKPANLMFTADGQVVLTDFGIARLIDDGRGRTRAGRAAGTPAYMAPELHQGAPGDKLSDIYALGVMLYELLTGRVPFMDEAPDMLAMKHVQTPPPAPRQLNPDIPGPVEDVILTALSKNPADRSLSAGAMAQALRDGFGIAAEDLLPPLTISTSAPVPRTTAYSATSPDITPIITPPTLLPTPPCPYRGLFAFQEPDAPFFFGREDFTDRLAAMVEQKQMVTVLGPSGSGKSSVVFAGLLPRLRQGIALQQARGKAWAIASLRPGSRPFEALANALLTLLHPQPESPERLAEVQRLGEELRSGQQSLGRLAQQILAAQAEVGRMLLVVDQFEELYTLCAEPEVRRAFVEALLNSLVETPHLHLVGTMRADFLSAALSYRPLADALQEASLILGPMTRAELERAIREPARRETVAFERGLIERILDDVGDEPGNLPLLEFALTTLWEKQTFAKLTHSAYDEIEHVAGALARYAEAVYDSFPAPKKEQARQVFVQLISPGEGTEDTRRQATRAELGEGWPLAQQLASARLVVTNRDPGGQDTAEIVHEALFRSWSRLREWMRANRNFRSWQERLRSALRQWESSGRDEGALLRGALLVGAEGWLAEREAEIGEAERGFIRASIALRERENAEREALRQRELETIQRFARAERERAEEQERMGHRLRRRAVLLAIALIVAAIATTAALVSGLGAVRNVQRADALAATAQTESQEARRAIRAAQAREWAATARLMLERDPQLSLRLALQAVEVTRAADQTVTLEASSALREVVHAIDPFATLPASLEELVAAARQRLKQGWTLDECQQYLRMEACPELP
jgi:serine/threonine protein kinase/KaiC/GvpD/RAD55 family RecA-like ATPase